MPLTLQDILPYILGQKVDNSSQQSSILYVNGIFLPLVVVVTSLRFWVRFGMLRAGGLDDFLMVLAVAFACLLSISCFVGEDLGLGKHIWNLSPGNPANIAVVVAKVTKSLFGCYLSYSTAMTFTKLSIISSYMRIFSPGNLRKTILVILVLVIGFWISSIFAIIFTCVPVNGAWDYAIKSRCYPIVNFFYASASFNILTDIILCILPMKTLWALSMPRPQRVILICLFGGGFFACVASILRLTHLKELAGGIDITYGTTSSLNWSVIEVDMGIICASIPSLRPIAKYIAPKYFSHSSPSGKVLSNGTTYASASKRSGPSQSYGPLSKFSAASLQTAQVSTIDTEKADVLHDRDSMHSSRRDIVVRTTVQVQSNDDDAPPPSTPTMPSRTYSYNTPQTVKREGMTVRHKSTSLSSLAGGRNDRLNMGDASQLSANASGDSDFVSHIKRRFSEIIRSNRNSFTNHINSLSPRPFGNQSRKASAAGTESPILHSPIEMEEGLLSREQELPAGMKNESVSGMTKKGRQVGETETSTVAGTSRPSSMEITLSA